MVNQSVSDPVAFHFLLQNEVMFLTGRHYSLASFGPIHSKDLLEAIVLFLVLSLLQLILPDRLSSRFLLQHQH